MSPLAAALLLLYSSSSQMATAFTTINPPCSHAFRSIGLSMVANREPQAQNGTETLTGLTNNLLKAHQEMQQELKALEAAQARDRGLAVAGEDGIFRIVSKEQYL